MILFASAVTDLAVYERCAAAGIDRVREPDSEILAHQSTGTLFRNYNLLLDVAAERDDLEALVLLHQDAEIVDPGFCASIREALRDPDVAIVGCAGAIGVRGIAWWEGVVTWASFTHRYTELGGGQFDSLTYRVEADPPAIATTGEVDSIDGFIMALSPWAVRELRFDESLGKLHGYDYDICCQARAAGKKVATADFKMVHHHDLELISDPDTWIEVHMRLAEKWEGRLPQSEPGGDLRRRALRAEAEAAAAKGANASQQLRYYALEKHMLELHGTLSWRITRPLRALKRWLRPRGATEDRPTRALP